MSFKALTESQIVSNMIDTYSSLALVADDMNQGSVIRSAFEAFAQELKRYYQNMQESAAETQRMAAYTMFKFPLDPAKAAYTMETISVSEAPLVDVDIPAGTTVQVPGTTIQYKTPVVLVFPAGQTSHSIRVVCTQTGSIGNQLANTVTQLVTPISGLTDPTVTNPMDIRNGADLETEDRRANRFQEWINSLHAGDIRALIYGAKSAKLFDAYGYISEQVTGAQVVEGSGSNIIYIDNGYYSTSASLVAECQKVINGYLDSSGKAVRGYKAAGIPTTVQIAAIQSVPVSISIATRPGYSFDMVKTSVVNSVKALVLSLDVGKSLTTGSLQLAIGQTPGVLNLTVQTPSADVTPAAGTRLRLPTGYPIVNLLT